MPDLPTSFRAPRRSRVAGARRFLAMKWGHFIRGSAEPAPVGRPDYYRRELADSLFVRSADALPVKSFVPEDHTEPSAVATAEACHRRYGVYPLNFSFPRPKLMPRIKGSRPHFLSSTIPGEPFSFDTWDAYLEEYRSSYFALSTKKGGWDTFRHLEVLFSGAIPLLPRLSAANPYSLAHFPKRALISVMQTLEREGPALPDEHTRQFFREYATNRLSSRAMAENLATMSGISGSRVLYLDQGLATRTDYLSAFTLIGLSELSGLTVIPAYQPDYLYEDYTGDTRRLYGRGFGYTTVLPTAAKSTESLDRADARTAAGTRDLVALADSCESIVVGNYDGNRELVEELVQAGIPAQRFVCIVGSDLVPDRALFRAMAGSEMTFFVREFPGA